MKRLQVSYRGLRGGAKNTEEHATLDARGSGCKRLTNTSSQRNREAKTRAGCALEPSHPNAPGGGFERPRVGPYSEFSTGASGRGQSRGAGMRWLHELTGSAGK